MTRPEVSVIIPTRDRPALLAQAIESVLAQRVVRLDVIVVDDGSLDGTGAWLRSLGDPRLVTVAGGGRGVAAARNAGLERVTAPLVAFLDDDDLWAPDKLEALRRRSSTGWSCTAAVLVDGSSEIIGIERPWVGGDVATVSLAANPVPGGASGVVAETELVRSVGGFDGRYKVLAHWELWVRMAHLSELGTVDRPLHAYRVHEQAMSGAVAEARREVRLLEQEHRARRVASGVTVDLARMEYWMGERAQRSGDRFGAAGAILRSARRNGSPRAVARAVEAVVRPGPSGWRDRRRAAAVDRDSLAEVRAWLPSPAGTDD